jgi:perosamine synthetase
MHAILYNEAKAGVTRESFVDAVRAELAPTIGRESDGPLVFAGYCEPIYMLPMYQKRMGMGGSGFPFESPYNKNRPNYDQGLCPVAEDMLNKVIAHELFRPPATEKDLDDVIAAFHKVWEHRSELLVR